MKTLAIFLIIAVVAIAYTYANECQVGETKRIECNDCRCINGNWACTKKSCQGKRATRCTPGETFKQDCNTCVCAPDGRNAACTLKACH